MALVTFTPTASMPVYSGKLPDGSVLTIEAAGEYEVADVKLAQLVADYPSNFAAVVEPELNRAAAKPGRTK